MNFGLGTSDAKIFTQPIKIAYIRVIIQRDIPSMVPPYVIGRHAANALPNTTVPVDDRRQRKEDVILQQAIHALLIR